ncbi:SDR family NAD(P)-dependent oxidoreductase [Aeromonas veronii]|uniref:SDR family NAD(P)-dependent oxidoreductase n=1 Tax=Aeromonas veronii TaxID=654 RepID=UPI002442A702|nr:SDR family NAD(P)-dependent oxidoreductase [Aeromonas veronii]
MNELTNHTPIALVTGAAGGIGRQLCIGLAEAGYRVIATDLAPHAFDHPEIHFHPLDLRDEQAIVGLFAEVRAQHGGIHLLINNGAISKFHTHFEDLSAAQFDQVMTVNVRGAMLCARAFVQANRDLPYGRIINIASTRWQQNEPGWDAYGASKGALVALTQSLANSLADYPVTVNAISPGWIQAEDYHTLTEADHRQHPSGRVGRPDDITRACLFLADPRNDFINGANLVVDGGMSKKMIYHTSASFWEE